MWTVFWSLWVGAGIAVELFALKRRQSGDTLSEQYWKLEDVLRHPALRWLLHVVTLGFLGWLGLHFVAHIGA